MMIKTYSELITLPTLKERFEYLKLGGKVGELTFGYERYLNQTLYRSPEWLDFRDDIIIRDKGYELGLINDLYEITGPIFVHHINPVSIDDIINRSDLIFDPENTISCSKKLHDAIHYGSLDSFELLYSVINRKPNDTCPWRK